MSGEPALLALALSVADGTPVDWDAAESAAVSGEDLQDIRALRLLATLGGVHRTGSDDAEPSPTTAPELIDGGRAIPHWGHFALLERIGEGSQGEVFNAIDTKLDRPVALKFLKRTRPHETVDSVLREARLLARVRHRNVVTVYGADLIDGRVGLWMELVAGSTLDVVVSRAGSLSAMEAALLGIDLCGAVAAVHDAGLLHRDIKPQNVMRERGGRYVLMDFGVGHDLLASPDAARAGTPLFLAPEVLRGGAATTQADIYALGVLLYYASSSDYPAHARSVAQLVEAHASGRTKRLAEARAGLPDGFRRIVECALHPDPSARYKSVADMADALADFASSNTTRSSSRTPRRHWMAPLALVCAVALLAVGAGLRWQPPRVPSASARSVRLAVLPLQDLSRDRSLQYLADGLADQLITDLGQRTDVTVIARTSSRQFVGGRAVADIARDANVDIVVEGSVNEEVDDVAVAIRVVAAGTGAVLSSHSTRVSKTLLRSVPPILLGHVAGTLKAPTRAMAAASTQLPLDPRALDAYFRGWNEYWRLSRDGFKEARQLFERTVALQPDYAPAHSALAYVTFTSAVSYHELPVEDALAIARQEVGLALSLDPNNPHALATSGWLKFYGEWDWPAAEEMFRRAVDLNPSDAQIRWMYAQLLLVQNRADAGLQEARLAQRLDPLNPTRHSNVATALYYGRHYQEAANEVRLLLAQDPNAAVGHFGLARFLTAMGQHDEATIVIKTALNGGEPPIRAELARILFVSGRTGEALALVPAIEADYRSGRLAPEYYAYIALARGELEQALQLVREGVDKRSASAIWINVDPRYDTLRSDERFVELLRTMKLAS